jgi:hypothetical protein
MYVKGENLGQWYYSVSHPIELLIDCPKKYSKVLISGQGILRLAVGCSADDGTHYLPAVMEFHEMNFSNAFNTSVEPLPNLNIKLIDTMYLDIANTSKNLKHLLTSIEKLDTHDVPTLSLPNVEQGVKLLSPINLDIKRIHYTGSVITVLVVFLLCSILLCMCCKRVSKSRTGRCPLDVNNEAKGRPSAVVPLSIYNMPQASGGTTTHLAPVHAPLFPVL